MVRQGKVRSSFEVRKTGKDVSVDRIVSVDRCRREGALRQGA